MTMKPKAEALAYRIWAYCEPRGWDCLVTEVADALGDAMPAVRRVCGLKGWTPRMRVSAKNLYDQPKKLYYWDDDIVDII